MLKQPRRVLASYPSLLKKSTGQQMRLTGPMIIARPYWHEENQRWQGQFIGWASHA